MKSRMILGLAVALMSAGLAAAPAPPPDRPDSGFAIRGIKGLWWQGMSNYRKALPWLARHRLNFLMFCYTSFPASATDWRADYTPAEMRGFREMAVEARRLGVTLCVSFNPGIWSKPPLAYSSDADYERALHKVQALHAAGIRWFALCLDDIGRELLPQDRARFGTLQAAQVHFVNRLWADVKNLRPAAELIFCPSAYTTEDARNHRDYIDAIGQGIAPEVRLFWTGPTVCSPSIGAADARTFGAWIRRKPFVWDNYPVNDMFPWRPLLSPVKNRTADLPDAVSGYLANPMKQWYASTIPLATLAEYLNDPAHYDPAAALERSIAEYPAQQQPAVRLLVTLYGSSFLAEPHYPPEPRAADRQAAAEMAPCYRQLRDLLASNRGLRGLWDDVRPTVEEDLDYLERKARDRQTDSPLRAIGDDFEGGGGPIYGYRYYGRRVGYVYSRQTGKDAMRVAFYLAEVPREGARLRLAARDDDSGRKVRVRIALNDCTLVDGDSPFSGRAFSARDFVVPASALKVGANVLEVRNAEPSGSLGMPPWFMVSDAQLLVKTHH